jgi:hypothetical protein
MNRSRRRVVEGTFGRPRPSSVPRLPRETSSVKAFMRGSGVLDDYFEQISRSNLDPATQLPDIHRIAAKYQLEIVGPPHRWRGL